MGLMTGQIVFQSIRMHIKKLAFLLITGICLLASAITMAQTRSGVDSTGLPGDQFSLQGALEMFKKAGSPEEFEKLINTESNSVNNLDLNGDGNIDYVKVIDKFDGTTHAFILQVPVSDKENQDVAVIELDKTGDESAIIQIVGDEDLYGEEVIVEPNSESSDNAWFGPENETMAGGPFAEESLPAKGIVVNVWFWPCVRYIYVPVYRPWISPWHWSYYPGWWRPWRPFAWHVFYPRVYVYHRPFVVVHTYRVARARRIYRPVRVTSTTVRTRNAVVITRYKATRPVNARPVTRPGTRPVRPGTRPSTRPVTRPGTRPATRPGTRPSVKPVTGPATRPATRPGSRPVAKPNVQSTRPSATGRPAAKPSSKPAGRRGN
jgi:hypothetical protein